MTLLRSNPSIEFLSLRNNNISDTAIQCLHTFWSFSFSFPQLDLRHNPIMQSSSFALLRCIRPPVLFSPQEPLPIPRYPLDVIADKAFRDCCIVLQLLDCLLAVSRQPTVPAKIPRKLLFSRALPTHRTPFLLFSSPGKIAGKLIEQPSLLARRIDGIRDYFRTSEGVLPLLCANFRLLLRFLLSGVSLYRQVSPFLSSSPPASLSPSPTLKAAETPGIPAGQAVSLSDGEFDSAAFLADGACRVEAIPAEIASTVGPVRRVGAVKIAVIRLLGEAIGSGFFPVIGCVVGSNLNRIAMVWREEEGFDV